MLREAYLRAEAGRRFSVVHVAERGVISRFRVEPPLTLLDMAACIRDYEKRGLNQRPAWFSQYLPNARPISAREYEQYLAERLGNSGRVIGVFKIDLARCVFSTLSAANCPRIY